MNFVQGGYEPRFLVRQPRALRVSGEIEAVGAAHHVLTQLYPERVAALAAALDRYTARLPNAEFAARARLWGKQLGSTVYAVIGEQRAVPAGNAIGAADRAAASAASAATTDAWNRRVARAIAARSLAPIEHARIHALASLAASRAHAMLAEARSKRGTTLPCAECAVEAATQTVMEAELGAPRSTQGVARVSEVRWGAVRSNDAVAAAGAVRAGEALGTQAGKEVLSFYRAMR
jgi:hypothetical protein